MARLYEHAFVADSRADFVYAVSSCFQAENDCRVCYDSETDWLESGGQTRRHVMRHLFAGLALLILSTASLAQESGIEDQLKIIASVGNGGHGHAEAITAWQEVGKSDAESLPAVLKAIDDDSPIAANWLRAAVDQIAERSLRNGHKLPTAALESLIFDAEYSPRSRRLAYEWLSKVDSGAEQRIVPRMLNDTSLEMRRDAVDMTMKKAEEAADDKAEAAKLYEQALSSARDTDQIDAAFEKLEELGRKVDLPTHFGFITSWRLIGPFDNVDKKGFAVAYPPEKEVRLQKSYRGKTGEVAWIDHQTKDKYGMVNLNEALGKNMGAAAYAYAEFESPDAKEVDLRLGCICAAKLWLNGEQLMEHEVYHSGTKIDQYVVKGKLKAGINKILLKVCQNEQTEQWAQDWEFQFRICDSVGTAILAANRSLTE